MKKLNLKILKKVALKTTDIQVDVKRLAIFIHSLLEYLWLKESEAMFNKVGNFVIFHEISFGTFSYSKLNLTIDNVR